MAPTAMGGLAGVFPQGASAGNARLEGEAPATPSAPSALAWSLSRFSALSASIKQSYKWRVGGKGPPRAFGHFWPQMAPTNTLGR